MPICRNCHRTISKFDRDICPYCGTPNPIADNYETKDVTSFLNTTGKNQKLYRSKSRLCAALLCLFVGEFGIHSFYLGFHKRAWIELAITLLLIGGLGSVLCFLTPLSFWGYLLPFFVLWLVAMAFSIRYFTQESLTDANGVFLR